MSDRAVPLKRVLTRVERAMLNLEGLNTEDVKRAARFWFGTTASNKFRKFECISALTDLLKRRSACVHGRFSPAGL